MLEIPVRLGESGWVKNHKWAEDEPQPVEDGFGGPVEEDGWWCSTTSESSGEGDENNDDDDLRIGRMEKE